VSNEPEWFAAKRYGYGAGLPISWQGWVLMLAYLGLLAGAAFILSDSSIAFISIAAILTSVFLFVCARTTRGGWRWRWGEEN
jgi:hypothetical protein